MTSVPSFFTLSNENKSESYFSHHGKCIHNIFGTEVEVKAKWWPSYTKICTVAVFVPGNPGVIGFYDSFLDALHLRYRGRGLALLAHGMLGHAPQLPTPKYAGLLHQIESLIQVLVKIKKEWTKIRVVVISHSMGTWVATQSLKAGADIDAIFGLFPVLSNISLTPRGKQMSWMFEMPFPYIIITLAILLRPFAPFLVKALFKTWPSHQQEVLVSIIRSPGVILSCLAMAREEMKMIKMPDEEFLKQNSVKLWLYYGIQDHWVGAERERIVNILEKPGGLRIVHCKHGIPHDFCILHGELMVEQCGTWLENGDLI